MTRLVNPVKVAPADLQAGDVMVVTVTCHIISGAGELEYRLYRCPYPLSHWDIDEYGVPQGDRVGDNNEQVIENLFPVVAWAEIPKSY